MSARNLSTSWRPSGFPSLLNDKDIRGKREYRGSEEAVEPEKKVHHLLTRRCATVERDLRIFEVIGMSPTHDFIQPVEHRTWSGSEELRQDIMHLLSVVGKERNAGRFPSEEDESL